MGLIFENSHYFFNKNKNKVFFQDLNVQLVGEECLNLVDKISSFIEKENIRIFAIISNNSICWPLWYIAADKNSCRVLILNPDTNHEILDEILKKNNAQIVIDNPDIILSKNEIGSYFQVIRYKNKLHFKRSDVLFTSGTTSVPKGVIVNSSAYLHIAKILNSRFNTNYNDIELLSMPFYHSFGLTRLRCILLCGASAIISDGLKKFPEIYKLSITKKITGLSLVPSGINIMKNLLRKKIKNLVSTIKYFEIGSSSIDYEIKVWLKENFKNVIILHHYGMTEASRSFIRERSNKEDFSSPDTWVGDIIKDCSYKLKTEKDNDCNTKIGELMIKGPHLFESYTDDKLNSDKLINGWFRTGDICEIKNGKILLIGRSDNQINIGGFKLQAEVLEEIIIQTNDVRDCICLKTKSRIFGDSISCVVELKNINNKENFLREIKIKLKNYPSYYRPEEFIFDKIKLTENGKKIRQLKLYKNEPSTNSK